MIRFSTPARSPGHPLSLLFRPSLVQHDYKNNSPSSTGPWFCLRQPSPRLISTKGVEDDTPHRREGSKQCLYAICASLRLVIVPYQKATSLTAHGLNIIAWDNNTHKGERGESPLSVFASTNTITVYPWSNTPQSRGITNMCSDTCS